MCSHAYRYDSAVKFMFYRLKYYNPIHQHVVFLKQLCVHCQRQSQWDSMLRFLGTSIFLEHSRDCLFLGGHGKLSVRRQAVRARETRTCINKETEQDSSPLLLLLQPTNMSDWSSVFHESHLMNQFKNDDKMLLE